VLTGPGVYGSYGLAVSWLIEEVAPAGSASTASRNGPASSGAGGDRAARAGWRAR
jgi:hypothetical protein